MSGHGFARCVCAALLVFALPTFAAAPAKRVVLPDAVIPEHYRIDFTPDIAGLTFKGSVEIDVNVRRATSTIVLNAADLSLDSASLSGEAKSPTITLDDKIQTATLTFERPLTPGPRKLAIAYHGTIYTSASGLFALDYKAPQGSPKPQLRALFTQFENSDARRFVPCWDEPGVKATYELSATLPADLMPISNMPVAATEKLAGGLQRVSFAKSPKMSTYLLFFGAGDFERVHRMVQGVDVGIVVKRGDTASAAYALDATAELLPYYNEYFGTPYPLPKLDLLAGPGSSQFFGAMENWGAIFYFERFLLVDSKISTQLEKQYVYSVIAHEVAHQWFGDLVTMAWWDDLWLNEGFASWMANKATDHFNPEWKVWLQSLPATHSVMQRDARDGTHAIIQTIEDVAQAANAFDDITYYKGAAVIRALESHVGEAAFRAGVRRYMREHKYGNTVTDDLWAAIGKESAAPVPQIAHDYTLQAGVPMVNMLSAKCAGGKTTLSLNQTHFAIDADSTAARVWHLPVKVAVLGQAPSGAIVAGEKPTQIVTAGCGPVVLNAGQAGYLRSHYSREGLKAVMAHYAELTPDDQLGLLMDTQSLASAGEQPMADYMDLTKQVPVSVDPVIASTLTAATPGHRRALQRTRQPGGIPGVCARRTETIVHARGLGRTPRRERQHHHPAHRSGRRAERHGRTRSRRRDPRALREVPRESGRVQRRRAPQPVAQRGGTGRHRRVGTPAADGQGRAVRDGTPAALRLVRRAAGRRADAARARPGVLGRSARDARARDREQRGHASPGCGDGFHHRELGQAVEDARGDFGAAVPATPFGQQRGSRHRRQAQRLRGRARAGERAAGLRARQRARALPRQGARYAPARGGSLAGRHRYFRRRQNSCISRNRNDADQVMRMNPETDSVPVRKRTGPTGVISPNPSVENVVAER